MKSVRNRPIGVFDSGVGGLTVVRSMARALRCEDIIYFGDTARVPYGNKSRSTIIRFARQIMKFMLKKNVKMVVVACNTASSLSLSVLRKTYSIPIIGVIKPGIKEAIRVSKNKKIGVIGTKSTISSGAYEKELTGIDKSYRLFSKDCPLFVPLVENRFTNNKVTYQVAKGYLKVFKNKSISTLILGCTHYPILKTIIGKVMGKTKLIDSSYAVTREVKEVLLKKRLEARHRKTEAKIECFVTDDVEGFRKAAGIFLKQKISVKKVAI